MDAAKIILKFLMILLTSTWGVFFGILAPLVIMSGGMDISSHHVFIIWLVMTVMGYFTPCVLAMLKVSKIAAVCSVAGTVLTLYIHATFSALAKSAELQSVEASFMYLPQIFMTILTVIYAIVLNPQYFEKKIEKRKSRLNAPAPSILEKSERKKK